MSYKETSARGQTFSFILCLLLSFALITPSGYAQEMMWTLERNFESFAENHQAMMGVAVHMHEEKSIPHNLQEGENHHTLHTSLQNIFFPKAYASSGEVCLYGGWPSFMSQNGKCVAPWTHSQNSTLSNYGPTYSQNHYCGGENLFRCNPVLFGPGEDGRGHCVEYSNNDEVSHQCYQQGKQNIEQLYELYKSDEDFKDKYQQLVVLMIGFCRENTHYTSCHALIQSAVDFRNYTCEESLVELLEEEELESLISNWSKVEDHMSGILSGRSMASNSDMDPTMTPAPVRGSAGGMAPIALGPDGRRDYTSNATPSPSNWNRFHNTDYHMGPAPDIEEWEPLDYQMDEGEESELIRNGRHESNVNNYDRLDRIAYEAYAQGGEDPEAAEAACLRALDRAYKKIKPKPLWADLSRGERAKEIYKHAEHIMSRISQEGTPGTNPNNPHHIAAKLSPWAGACIAIIETRASLNPHAMNYTFCKPRRSSGGPVSTAHGLGQMTRRTFENLRKQNNLPLTVAKEYDGLNDREAFKRMNGDVTMQMEVLMRYLNYEIKLRKGLKEGVAAYDQDQKSKYMIGFNTCIDCFNQKGKNSNSAPECDQVTVRAME